MAKVGLLVIATGKYDQFIPVLYKSMKKYFLTNEEVWNNNLEKLRLKKSYSFNIKYKGHYQ